MTIFVAKFDFKTKKEDLIKAFSQYGEVTSAKLIRDRKTGQSKGYAFVTMPNDMEAQHAIAALDDREHQGRKWVVKEANSKTQ
jgi:RNA recognition motif-containing protein